MSDAAFELVGVTKSYGPRAALRGVDLRVGRGETVGFVGPNGAGKTTCLRLLIGLTARDGGRASVLGLDPSAEALAIRRACSYLPGETGLYDNLTGHEMLDFALAFYPRRHLDLQQRMLAAFGLPLEQKVRRYSAGMKQQLALMTALVPDVELYLLDEPDRNLDPSVRWCLRDLLHELQQRGKTVVLSSHHLREVEAVAQRMIFLLQGRVVDPARVEAALRDLRRVVRVRLRDGGALPDGTLAVMREPDGCLRVEPREEPLAFASRLDPAAVVSVEIGATRLDDLYRILLEGEERS